MAVRATRCRDRRSNGRADMVVGSNKRDSGERRLVGIAISDVFPAKVMTRCEIQNHDEVGWLAGTALGCGLYKTSSNKANVLFQVGDQPLPDLEQILEFGEATRDSQSTTDSPCWLRSQMIGPLLGGYTSIQAQLSRASPCGDRKRVPNSLSPFFKSQFGALPPRRARGQLEQTIPSLQRTQYAVHVWCHRAWPYGVDGSQ